MKKALLKSLASLGYRFDKREGSVDTFLHKREIGIFNVYIILSNKVRIVIETSGKGTYYIILKEENSSYDTITSEDVIETFKKFTKACNEFNKSL